MDSNEEVRTLRGMLATCQAQLAEAKDEIERLKSQLASKPPEQNASTSEG